MKRFFIFLLISIPFLACAQNYFRAGTEWIEEIYPDPPFQSNGENKIWLEESESSAPGLAMYQQYNIYGAEKELIAYIKTEGEKVYFCRPSDADTPVWYLMYDFGLQPGESCTVSTPPPSYLEKPWSTTFRCEGIEESNPQYYGQTTMSLVYINEGYPEDGIYNRAVWIKGLSDTRGVNSNFGAVAGCGWRLIEASADGAIIYEANSLGQTYFDSGTEWIEEIMKDDVPQSFSFAKYAITPPETDNTDGLSLTKTFEDSATPPEIVAYIKSNREKVYFRLPEAEEWYLMYDFGLQPGESAEVCSPSFKLPDGQLIAGRVTCRELTASNPKYDNWPTLTLDYETTDLFGNSQITSITWIRGLGDPWGVLKSYEHIIGVEGGPGTQIVKAYKYGVPIYSITPWSASVDRISDNLPFKWEISGDRVVICDTTGGMDGELYSASGLVLAKFKTTAGETRVTLPEKGVPYILKIGNTTLKIVR